MKSFVLLLLAGFAVTAAALSICPNCGYEYEAGASVCSHCQAELGTPEENTASDNKTDTSAAEQGTNRISRRALQRAHDRAEKYSENGNHEACFLEARNAIAWATLVDGNTKKIERSLQRMMEASRKSIPVGQRKCPVCHGTGKKQQLRITLKGKVGIQEDAGSHCPACNGRGVRIVHATKDEIARKMRTAQANFDSAQQKLLLKRWHTIWLPRGINTEELTVREEVALKTAAAPLCSTCYGMKWTGCETCQGSGRLRCTNEHCVMGQEVCPKCSGSKKESVERGGQSVTRSCRHCRQIGISTCRTCGGDATLRCRDCQGRKRILCTACKGSGVGEICSRCDGRGFQTCSRCDGSGIYKGTSCRSCKGEGVVLCKSCKGYGRDN